MTANIEFAYKKSNNIGKLEDRCHFFEKKSIISSFYLDIKDILIIKTHIMDVNHINLVNIKLREDLIKSLINVFERISLL